jgi:hypothetical protein
MKIFPRPEQNGEKSDVRQGYIKGLFFSFSGFSFLVLDDQSKCIKSWEICFTSFRVLIE